MVEVIDIVESWRDDPVLFVQDMFGVKPSSQQRDMLSAAGKVGARVAVKSGHGTGKSTSLAWLVLWSILVFDDVKVLCTAPTGHQLNDVLLSEIKKWHQKMLGHWKDKVIITTDKVSLEGSLGFAAMRTGRKENPEALQGRHAENMIILIDEASGIDDTVYEVARGTLSTPSARIIMASNPTRSTGYFYNAFHRNRANWDLFTFSCLNSPFVAQEYIREMQEEYGDESDIYKVRVLGEFPKGGDLQFITTSVVNSAVDRYYDETAYNFAALVLGVDVAYFGGDRSVIYLRQGLHARELFSVQGIEITDFASIVAKLWDEHNADAVFVDGIGVGAGVVSYLRSIGKQPISVAYSGSSATEGYHNKRAECWGLMRDWLKEGWIPNDPKLKDDLTAPEYSFTVSGKLILERKENMRKRGLASPDFADALALTFANPVVANRKRGPVGLIGRNQKQTDVIQKYNPFHSLKNARKRR